MMSGNIEGRIASHVLKIGKPINFVESTNHQQIHNAPDCISCNKHLFGIPNNRTCQSNCGVASRPKRRKIAKLQ
jgi:hypothetical protein